MEATNRGGGDGSPLSSDDDGVAGVPVVSVPGDAAAGGVAAASPTAGPTGCSGGEDEQDDKAKATNAASNAVRGKG
ncbi:MAG: hypothetical protein M3164_01310 [Actinomycetota bacterium]|nr:hypothetical protein [Actinomycetota bacterium]